MATITSLGIGSGLDVQNIVSSLVDAERKPTEARLERQQAHLQAQVSAFGQLKSDLGSMHDALGKLKLPTFWQRHQTTSSNESVVTATASAVAKDGRYQLSVNQIAQSHAVATGAFDSVDEVVGSGELTIRFGRWSYDESGVPSGFEDDSTVNAKTLTIDTSNNTLNGLRDAINDAGIGVRASIVNDGSGYRLVMTSNETGAAKAIEISVADGDGNDTDASGLSRLAFNTSALNMQQTLEGKDAEIVVDGLTVTSASNLVAGVVDGVTLNLRSAAPGTNVSLEVGLDDKTISESMQAFVEAYNQFRTNVSEFTAYDEDSQQGAVLLGDATIRSVNNQLRRMLGQVIPGLENANIRSLADVGLSTNRNTGQLSLDEGRFKQMLQAHPEEMQALFSTRGSSTDAQVRYLGANSMTQAGTYAVEVEALATQGRFQGGSVLPADFSANPLIIDADNDEFTLDVDEIRSGTIQLSQGSYATGGDLAQEIQARINADEVLKAAGRHVEVSYDAANQHFEVTSASFGSTSNVSFAVVDTNTAAQLGFSVVAGEAGMDVVGKINGVEAKGKGQFLFGAEDDPGEGLQLKILGGELGARGSVSLVRGVADRLDDLVRTLSAADGAMADKIQGLNGRLDKLSEEQQKLDERMERMEVFYLNKFNAMDALVAQFKSTGAFLTQQLKALEPNSNN